MNLPQHSQAGARWSEPTARQMPSAEEGTRSKTITTPGGSTVTIAGGSGSKTTEGGATIGGAGVGVKIEGAGGQTYVGGHGIAGASKGDRAAVAAGSGHGIQTAGGATAVSGRGIRAATNGTSTAVRTHSGAAIRGPGGNAVAYGRGASFVNGQFVGGHTWRAVNGHFNRWNYYTPGWIVHYPGAWWPGRWAIATTAWATATWAVAGSYCGCVEAPVYYDYSENVTYQDGNVYFGDQPVATAEQYYDQASAVAQSGQEAQNEDWMPLGVFAVAAEGQTNADKIIQLAVNKEGIIRGNYHDLLADKVTPVTGAVDKQTQRVALKLEGNDSVVIETGLYNLTNDEVPVLVHLGPDRQEPHTLIRLQQPETGEAAAQQ